MSEISETGRLFMEACDEGKGWEVCSQYCHSDATFSVQAAALAGVTTVEAYAEWAKGLLTPIPDAHVSLISFSEDEERSTVTAVATFHGTQTGPGGPVEPTGNTVATDYVYAMKFEDGRIRHITKVWNDSDALQQLGWA